MGCKGPSVVAGPATVGTLVDGAGPWPSWLPDLASCRGCRFTGGWGWLWGTGDPRSGANLLVGGAGSLHSWLFSLLAGGQVSPRH